MLETPRLDAKTYQQLFDEALARIPLLTGQWTDFNPQDTGIMLLELLAAMTELQSYYLDQVDDRYFLRYMDLLSPESAGEPLEKRLTRLPGRRAGINRAVCPGDYEALALASGLGIGHAHADRQNDLVTLTVYRESGPLSGAEEQRLYSELDRRRLLGTRLRLRQADKLPVDVRCVIDIDPRRGRPEACQAKLEQLIHEVIGRQPPGCFADPMAEEALRCAILALPEVETLWKLQIRPTDPVMLAANGDSPAHFMKIASCRVVVKGEDGHAN